MVRQPVRYASRELVGWTARKSWELIQESPFATLEEAQAACSRLAGEILQSKQSVTSPEGHVHFSAESATQQFVSWQAGPSYRQPREPIPGAEFASLDPACPYYIEPLGDRWAVKSQYDLEDADAWDLMLKGVAGDPVSAADLARLWHWMEAEAATKEEALRYARYLWGRLLVRHGSPPPPKSRFRAKLRHVAMRFV